MEMNMKERKTTIKVSKSTKELLQPYKNTYGTYEEGILALIRFFEGK